MLDNIVKLSVLVALIFLMTGLGVTMEPGKIWQHAKRPVGAVVATIVQFGVMPFIAWGIGTFMNVVLSNVVSPVEVSRAIVMIFTILEIEYLTLEVDPFFSF